LIDHGLCSDSIDILIRNIDIMYQYISSDHRPMRIEICGLTGQSSNDDNISGGPSTTKELMINWSKADDICIQHYRSVLTDRLSYINIPTIDSYSSVSTITGMIDDYYNALLSCIKSACQHTIPSHIKRLADNIVPGWNDFVKEKHSAARGAFLQWAYMGKPRCGFEYYHMVRTRSAFKLALRYCKQNEEMLRVDAYAARVAD